MSQDKFIILYDGVCNLCNSTIQFVLKNDSKKRFYFASLQSFYAKEELKELNFVSKDFSTILLIENNKVYNRSTAILKIVKRLRGFWPLLFYIFILIPKFIRDIVYKFISKNRYKWFGKQESCLLPDMNQKQRFLDLNEN